MMPPSASLAGPSANMMPPQSAHQPPAMHNPTETGSSGVQLQGQPPSSMMYVSKPSAQTGILPPPSSYTGPTSVQHHQFPSPPQAGTQPTVGQSVQQFPPPSSAGTHPPMGPPPQQVTPAVPKTETQTIAPHSVPMLEQSQPYFGGLRQPNQPPIMSTMAGPPLQTSNTNQFSNQTMGTVQAAPPMMSAQQPPPTSANVAPSAITGLPHMSGMPSSNLGPPRADHMGLNLSGPPLPSIGTVQPGIPPPQGNCGIVHNNHCY